MFIPFSNSYPYASKRNVTYSQKGMVATSQPLAAQAGLDILKKGGNAIDAAIATAACLTVTEPTSNGIGGDAFALVFVKDKLYGLNASGVAPNSISVDAIKDRGYNEIPRFGFIPVTVPGIPSAWRELSKRFGKLPLLECLLPAIEYARKGYPLSPTLAYHWNNAFKLYEKNLKGEEYESWFKTFAPLGRAPFEGELWFSKDHADTLEKIGKTNADAFYKGELADKIDAFSQQYNGFIRKSDLMNYNPSWVEPISINYRGYNVWEIPPNGQGLIALQALNILKGFTFEEKDTIRTYHLQIEALKLAFSDGMAYITEPSSMPYSSSDLLSESYSDSRRKLINENASLPSNGKPYESGTVYLATADGEGNMVSYIQSNYMGFGSGLVVPGTGIALQNRGHNFSMNKSHPNVILPGKKPYHTIIPGFLTKDQKAIGPFGVMGGFMQPQGHVQVIMNAIDFHLNPQATLDAPRWQWMEGKKIIVESQMPSNIILGLQKLGHIVQIEPQLSHFGRGQIIWRNSETGILVGGTDPRTDSSIACW
ncbi:MAG: gamma-glutamyltransferase family protein [Firmicutes bacterium]|nr:gamma-glutamyltransferase family protein [Bacillota bacterium]